jgi:LETM1 and EF-hand domain-containing protein 1
MRYNSTLKQNDPKATTSPAVPTKETAQTTPIVADKTAMPAEPKLTLWEKVKHEAQHYWDGTKLLGYEIKVSTKLVAKMASGYELTRREDRQLQRTITDIIRLVPFSMFVIVPFAELLLPVALKLFPNMLPSTYESGKDKEAKTKKLRKTRTNVSQFLRKTVAESGMKFPVTTTPEQKEKFALFFKQVRNSGEAPSRDLVLDVARLFKDDLVLDNLSRPQLVAMAKYMNLQPFGTNMILRYRIRYRMRQLKRDDRAIDYEGVESLSVPELQTACASRGIKSYGVSPATLRDDLRAWLDLRLHQKVPSTLLVLSSAYSYGVTAEGEDSHYYALQSVLSALPEELYHEAELDISSDAATNKQRLEVVKEQQELIKDENAQEEESGHIIKVRDNLTLDDDHHHDVVPPAVEKPNADGVKAEEKKEEK